jgi:hypothetical protein
MWFCDRLEASLTAAADTLCGSGTSAAPERGGRKNATDVKTPDDHPLADPTRKLDGKRTL